MNAGQATIDWLYRKQLQVDEKWSVRTPHGFTWWAHQFAQKVEVIGSEPGPDGNAGYFIRVKTDIVRNLTLDDKAMAGVFATMMMAPTMAGPVYDRATKVLSLSSVVRVHDGIREWMQGLISLAAMLQLKEAQTLSVGLSAFAGGEPATSGHPTAGSRPSPDELLSGFAQPLTAAGKEPSSWRAVEFQQAVDQYMQRPPALLANGGGKGLTVEFPYGGRSSLCLMKADKGHPALGNGLLLLQRFPVDSMTDEKGNRLALELNGEYLDRRPAGYGFGSFSYYQGCINFTTFIPNAAYRAGLLPNLYFACAERARAMSMRFQGDDWTSGRQAESASAMLARVLADGKEDGSCLACAGTGRRPSTAGWLGKLLGAKPDIQCPLCGGTGASKRPRN
jgi:hypothetical protein